MAFSDVPGAAGMFERMWGQMLYERTSRQGQTLYRASLWS